MDQIWLIIELCLDIMAQSRTWTQSRRMLDSLQVWQCPRVSCLRRVTRSLATAEEPRDAATRW